MRKKNSEGGKSEVGGRNSEMGRNAECGIRNAELERTVVGTTPTETTPTETTPTDPTPTDPTPTDPTQTDPTQTDPTQTDPTQAEPSQAEATKAEPTQAKPNPHNSLSHLGESPLGERPTQSGEEVEHVLPTSDLRPPTSPPRTLSLWFPNWPIQRLVVQQPELRRKRIVLFRRDSRRGQVVSAASPLAMQSGACVDMPLSEAKSLLRAEGGFHIFEHDIEADFDAIKELADSLESFSPIVGLETIDPADFKRGHRPSSILLDVTGLAHLFGDESQLARQVMTHCDELGYLPRIAIGDTVGIAWAVSRYFSGQYFAVHQQPAVLPPGDQETIKQLPVDGLRLEPSVIDTLYQLGIETIGQLLRLSRNDLAMRFGDAINRRLDQLSGKLEEPVEARRKPAQFVAEQLLEYPTNHRETIEVIIARLVTELCSQMRSQQRGALEWTITMGQLLDGKPVSPSISTSPAPNSTIQFRVNLFQPTATTKEIMPLVEMQLEQALSPHTRKFRKRKRKKTGTKKAKTKQQTSSQPTSSQPNSGPNTSDLPTPTSEFENQFHRYTTIQIQDIKVSVTSDVLLVQQQRQLFDENPRLDRQSLAHLINRLASRLGTENVVYPSLQSGAQPEYSFRLRPLVDPTRKRRRRKTKPPNQSHALARPLRLFHPAKRLEAAKPNAIKIPDAGTEASGNSAPSAPTGTSKPPSPPALLRLATTSEQPSEFRTQRIINAWGPERIETGWWRGLTVCRDYWRIETETKQHFWVYRDLRSRHWFLHGEF